MCPTMIADEDVKFQKQTQDSSIKILSWKDVLVGHDSLFKYTLSELAGFASYIGYKYFLWNDIIYTKEDGVWMRTHMSIYNVK
jgi:hypothetical protein